MVTGTVTGGTTPTLSQLSGFQADQDAVTISRDAAGDYDITVTGFRGAQGNLKGYATATTISNMVSCTAQAYSSGDTAVFTFRVEDDGSTAQDNGFNFILVAD